VQQSFLRMSCETEASRFCFKMSLCFYIYTFDIFYKFFNFLFCFRLPVKSALKLVAGMIKLS